MNNRSVIVITICMIVVFTAFIVYDGLENKRKTIVSNSVTPSAQTIPAEGCIPTFADGGGPYYKANSPFRTKIVPDQNNGEKLVVKGKVLLNDCKTPVPAAIIDIWQANETGSYQDEWYRGQVTANDKGEYMFETVVPKGYGEGTAFRPPHIHFKIFRDNVEVITSQMFFPEVEGTPGFDKAYIMKLEEKSAFGTRSFEGYHDIILP